MSKKSPQSGRLYVVGTPIGNLEDISLRALRILKEVDLIAAEDTRVSYKLLAHYDIETPTTSFHEHSPQAQLQRLIEELQAGKKLALITDAGMPGISDPGEKLIAECLTHEIPVEAIPGPSAAITALVISGLPTNQFIFIGFIPRRGAERRELLEELAQQPRTLILYEAPHRLLETLQNLHKTLGNRRAVAARELTKKFEEVIRAPLAELVDHFTTNPPRGELTLIIDGAPAETQAAKVVRETEALPAAIEQARALVAQGTPTKDAARQVAATTGLSRRTIYNALQRLTS